jgi:hypothetical protein
MKFYIHYEVTEPEFTLPVLVEANDGRTIGDVKAQFVEAYNSRYFALNPCFQGMSFFILEKKKRGNKVGAR